MTELAEAVSVATGRSVTYTNLPQEQYEAVLLGAGVPAVMAAILPDADRGAANGELYVDPADLERQLGRPATSLAESLRTLVISGS